MILTKPKKQISTKRVYDYYIGIDTGTKTGICIWSNHGKYIRFIGSMPIHRALAEVKDWVNEGKDNVFIRVEDARKRTWFGNTGKERLKGAGSIERDAVIWEDFLTDLKVDFEMVHPKNNKTKLSAASFKKITGYSGLTNEHARDAAMLVYGL